MSTMQAVVNRQPAAVMVRDVGLRDGLQSIAATVPTPIKLQWLRAAYDSGLREIELGSFVPPRLLPQMADTAELVAAARALPGLVTSVLVPNLKGAQRALEAGVDLMLLPLSASKAHSLANLHKMPDEVVDEIGHIRALRDAAGSTCLIEVGISTAFGCTLQGRVEEGDVLRLLRAALDAGADRVGLADTVGYADPLQVMNLFEKGFAIAGARLACGHFHDTRGLGIANVFAAWQTGLRRFDACVGGIGGCPHAPGASGNVATEDLTYLFASMGVATGLNLDALLQLRGRVEQWIKPSPLHGTVWRARLPLTMTQ